MGATDDLVTPRERAVVKHGIRVGDLVEFEFDGVPRVGRVNRTHHRATALVEDDDGIGYTDGKRYKNFYVPVRTLQVMPCP